MRSKLVWQTPPSLQVIAKCSDNQQYSLDKIVGRKL